jgi:hypothetical protein
VPAYVDRSADLEKAAAIFFQQIFEYTLICASEQSFVADSPIAGN